MLHIFDGAPILNIKDFSPVNENEQAPKNIWKIYQFRNSDFREDFPESGSTNLHFEYNCTQLSNIDQHVKKGEDGLTCVQEGIQYHDEVENRTTADNHFRQIHMESQCLLDSEKYFLQDLGNKSYPERFHDCLNSKEEKSVVFSSKDKRSSLELSSDEIDYSITVIEETPTDLIDISCMFCLANQSCSNPSVLPPCSNNTSIINTTSIKDSIRNVLSSNIYAIVLQTFPAKKIFIKKGINIGETMELASISVGDESTFFFEITLWKESAAWVGRLFVGDVILLTDISFHSYINRNVGRTNKHSKIFNFHRPQYPYPENWSSIMCMRKLDSFVKWIHQEHKYLHSPVLQKNFSTVTLFSEMSCEYLRSIQAQIKDFTVHESKSDLYKFLGVFQPRVAIELQDANASMRTLFIWGDMYKHVEKIKTSIKKIIHVTCVMQTFDKTANVYILHTTSHSDLRFVDHNGDHNHFTSSLCTIDYFQFETESQSKVYLSFENIEQFDDIQSILSHCCSYCHSLLNTNGVQCNNCGKQRMGFCFSKFQMSAKKINCDSSHSLNVQTDGGICRDTSNSFEIIVYPEKAMKIFPTFLGLESKNSSSDALNVLKGEMDSLLHGKAFDFVLKRLDVNDEQFSFMKQDIFEFVDMVPS